MPWRRRRKSLQSVCPHRLHVGCASVWCRGRERRVRCPSRGSPYLGLYYCQLFKSYISVSHIRWRCHLVLLATPWNLSDCLLTGRFDQSPAGQKRKIGTFICRFFYLRLIEKRVLRLPIIELFSLDVTAEALRAIIGSKSAILLQRGPVDPKFQVEGVAPTNHSSSQ